MQATKRVVLGALVVLLAAACSPRELRRWSIWYERDPEPAMAYARCIDRHPRAEAHRGEARDGCFRKARRVADRPDDTSDDGGGSDTGGIYWPWNELAECESGGNWSINTGNGYYGGLQFSLTSWRAVGGSGYPHEHSASEQIHRGELLQDIQGWGAWPTCARIVGLL
jgi:transglycosylase-like protein